PIPLQPSMNSISNFGIQVNNAQWTGKPAKECSIVARFTNEPPSLAIFSAANKYLPGLKQ
ncbi:MAG: hypothetical protein ACRD19_04705, partial [Terriglobia bacterium]